jgi:hypothetical protein
MHLAGSHDQRTPGLGAERKHVTLLKGSAHCSRTAIRARAIRRQGRLAKPIKKGRAYLASRAGPGGALTHATEPGGAVLKQASSTSGLRLTGRRHGGHRTLRQPAVDQEDSDHRIDRAGSAAAETADPHLAGGFQRGRVRPGGQDRRVGRCAVFSRREGRRADRQAGAPPSAVPHRIYWSFASGYRPGRGGSSRFGPCRVSWSGNGWRPSRP